jgi:holin-like protein
VIAGLVQILFFQGLGEIFSHLLLPTMPGPVLGLVLMLAWLAARKAVPPGLDAVATTLVQHLGLLFVPAAVGVVMFLPQLRSNALAVTAALVASVVLTIAVPALVLRLLARGEADRAKALDEH